MSFDEEARQSANALAAHLGREIQDRLQEFALYLATAAADERHGLAEQAQQAMSAAERTLEAAVLRAREETAFETAARFQAEQAERDAAAQAAAAEREATERETVRREAGQRDAAQREAAQREAERQAAARETSLAGARELARRDRAAGAACGALSRSADGHPRGAAVERRRSERALGARADWRRVVAGARLRGADSCSPDRCSPV